MLQGRADPGSWNFCYGDVSRACAPGPPPRRVGRGTPDLAWRSVLAAPDMAAPITPDAAKLRALILSKLTYQLGKAAADASDRDWFMATALAVRDGIVDRFLHQMGVGASRKPQADLLFLPGIPDRPPAAGEHPQSRPERDGAGGAGGTWRCSRPGAAGGTRRGAGQWRARAAGGLLHGKHGHARHPRLRLRHPLRPRPVPAGHPGWLAAGIPRALAELRQPLGVRPAGDRPRDRLRRRGDASRPGPTAPSAMSGSRTRR